MPHTAPTVSGGGGPAWSGFVVTLPFQVYMTYGDTDLIDSMFPTMVRLLDFYANNTKQTDGLLHPWSDTQWDFLGDWVSCDPHFKLFTTVFRTDRYSSFHRCLTCLLLFLRPDHQMTPHGSESNVSSPENLLFNNAYLRYITSLVGKIATVLGKSEAAKKYAAAAEALSTAINRAFFDASLGVYLNELRQTWQVMPLAAGVLVPVTSTRFSRAFAQLQQSIEVVQQGHLDTGLTGTYFMTKLLTEHGRNDLLFLMANQTTFPSYGYFLEQGFTTWPESWDAEGGVNSAVSKMHGCYNAIGLWFLQGIAGITVDATSTQYPVTVRAGVDSGDISSATGSRFALRGLATSSWSSASRAAFIHNVTLPGNLPTAKVMVPTRDPDGADVMEAGKPVTCGGVSGVVPIGLESVNGISYLAMSVGSGSFHFTSSWAPPPRTPPAQ